VNLREMAIGICRRRIGIYKWKKRSFKCHNNNNNVTRDML